jgi:hypothetical protein
METGNHVGDHPVAGTGRKSTHGYDRHPNVPASGPRNPALYAHAAGVSTKEFTNIRDRKRRAIRDMPMADFVKYRASPNPGESDDTGVCIGWKDLGDGRYVMVFTHRGLFGENGNQEFPCVPSFGMADGTRGIIGARHDKTPYVFVFGSQDGAHVAFPKFLVVATGGAGESWPELDAAAQIAGEWHEETFGEPWDSTKWMLDGKHNLHTAVTAAHKAALEREAERSNPQMPRSRVEIEKAQNANPLCKEIMIAMCNTHVVTNLKTYLKGRNDPRYEVQTILTDVAMISLLGIDVWPVVQQRWLQKGWPNLEKYFRTEWIAQRSGWISATLGEGSPDVNNGMEGLWPVIHKLTGSNHQGGHEDFTTV